MYSYYMPLPNLICKDSVPACEKSRYHDMMANIGWFFFDLFVLGYVEDHKSGLSFRLPGGMQWSVYVEVSEEDCQ